MCILPPRGMAAREDTMLNFFDLLFGLLDFEAWGGAPSTTTQSDVSAMDDIGPIPPKP